jgi:hypothetical protein
MIIDRTENADDQYWYGSVAEPIGVDSSIFKQTSHDPPRLCTFRWGMYEQSFTRGGKDGYASGKITMK